MSADRLAARRRPHPLETKYSIQSRYLLNASALPADIAANMFNGLSFPSQVTHGYERNGFGGRLTRTRNYKGEVVFTSRLDGTGPLPEVGYDVPYGISGSEIDEQIIGRTQYYDRYKDTKGHRIGLTDHQVIYRPEPGIARVARLHVFRNGRLGEVGAEREIAGRALVVVDFSSIEQAQAFNAGRPAWMGENVTNQVSARKLVKQLAGEVEQDLAIGLLQQSDSIDDIRRKAA